MRIWTLTVIVLAMVVSLFLCHRGWAQQKMSVERMSKGTFSRLDSNGDGTITRAEYMAPHEKRFNEVDGNSDGVWTEQEYTDHFTKILKGKGMPAKRKPE